MAAHDDVDLDAGERAVVEVVAREGRATNFAALPKPGQWSVTSRSLSMVFGTWTTRSS